MKSRKSNANKVGNRKAGNRNNQLQITRHLREPAAYKQQPVHRWMLRFQITGGNVLDGLTISQLAQMCGLVALTANTSSFLMSQIRIKRISLWAPVATIGTPVTVGVKWADSPLAVSVGIANPPQSVEDTSTSVDEPAFCTIVPERNSYQNNWLASNATTTIVYISCPQRTIMDIHYQWVLDDVGAPPGGPALVAATAGVIYHKIVTGTAANTYTAINPLNSI